MSSTYDWEALARAAGSLGEFSETSGTDDARRALTRILSEENLVGAVDYYISGRPGSELARSVLRLLRPSCAMQRCYEIYRSDSALPRRRTAVELVRFICDKQALPWVSEFLADPDDVVQMWGAGVVDQLLWDHSVEVEEVAPLLEQLGGHPNPQVRERYAFIQEYLQDRQAP